MAGWLGRVVASVVGSLAVASCGGRSGAAVDAAVPDAPSADAPADLPAGVFAIPLSTPANAQGYFYTPVLVASGRSFLMDLDTGSTVVAIAGSGCASCAGLSPRYVPGPDAVDTKQTDTNTYAYGTGYAGEIYRDDIGLGHGSPAVAVDLVDIAIETEFFDDNDYQGILGVGRDDLLMTGTTGLLTSLVGSGAIADQIGIELCSNDGTFWLGGFDPAHAGSDMQFTPLIPPMPLSLGQPDGIVGGIPDSEFYAVDMTAMSLGSADVGLTASLAQDPVLDTGTSLFYIPTPVEATVIADLNADPGFAALFPGQVMTDPSGSGSGAGCVFAGSDVTDAEVDTTLPPLTMTFAAGSAGDGSGSIAVSASPLHSYLTDAGSGVYCMVMFPGGDGGNMIMGDTILRAFVTLIDLVHEQAGFAPDVGCAGPEAAPRAFARPEERGRGAKGWAARKARGGR